jgi:hypothetical protein
MSLPSEIGAGRGKAAPVPWKTTALQPGGAYLKAPPIVNYFFLIGGQVGQARSGVVGAFRHEFRG